MSQITDDVSSKDAKVVLCCNFAPPMVNSLHLFFASHGFISIFKDTLNEVITLGRAHTASLICINVFGYDTSWIRLITTMTLDPLFYEAPLLLVCQKVYLLLLWFSEIPQVFFATTRTLPLPVTHRSSFISYSLWNSVRSRNTYKCATDVIYVFPPLGRNSDSPRKVIIVDDSLASLSSVSYCFALAFT